MSRGAPTQGWAGSALGGCLWWHGSPPNVPALPTQPCTPEVLHALPVAKHPRAAPTPATQPLVPLLPASWPALGRAPLRLGVPPFPPACPVHRNADTFAQHPPFTHLHTAKELNPPDQAQLCRRRGHTVPPKQGDAPAWQGPICCDTQGGPGFGDTMPRLASRWQWPPLSPGLPRRAGVPAGQHPGVRALLGPAWPRWGREAALGWARGHGPHGQGGCDPHG